MTTYKRVLQGVTSFYWRYEGEALVKHHYVYKQDIYAWYRLHGSKHRERLPKGNRTRSGVNTEPKSHAVPDRERARRDWREKKGFIRDHRKSKWKRSAPQFYRQMSASHRRSWERQVIHKANWDEMPTESRRKFIDSRLWD